MATVTFDTLELVEKLVKSGFQQAQAEAVVRIIADAQQNLVTREYLDAAFAPIKSDIKELKLYIKGIMALLTLGLGWVTWLSAKLIAIAEKIL